MAEVDPTLVPPWLRIILRSLETSSCPRSEPRDPAPGSLTWSRASGCAASMTTSKSLITCSLPSLLRWPLRSSTSWTRCPRSTSYEFFKTQLLDIIHELSDYEKFDMLTKMEPNGWQEAQPVLPCGNGETSLLPLLLPIYPLVLFTYVTILYIWDLKTTKKIRMQQFRLFNVRIRIIRPGIRMKKVQILTGFRGAHFFTSKRPLHVKLSVVKIELT
jgi:hypothetical protein